MSGNILVSNSSAINNHLYLTGSNDNNITITLTLFIHLLSLLNPRKSGTPSRTTTICTILFSCIFVLLSGFIIGEKKRDNKEGNGSQFRYEYHFHLQQLDQFLHIIINKKQLKGNLKYDTCCYPEKWNSHNHVTSREYRAHPPNTSIVKCCFNKSCISFFHQS